MVPVATKIFLVIIFGNFLPNRGQYIKKLLFNNYPKLKWLWTIWGQIRIVISFTCYSSTKMSLKCKINKNKMPPMLRASRANSCCAVQHLNRPHRAEQAWNGTWSTWNCGRVCLAAARRLKASFSGRRRAKQQLIIAAWRKRQPAAGVKGPFLSGSSCSPTSAASYPFVSSCPNAGPVSWSSSSPADLCERRRARCSGYCGIFAAQPWLSSVTMVVNFTSISKITAPVQGGKNANNHSSRE